MQNSKSFFSFIEKFLYRMFFFSLFIFSAFSLYVSWFLVVYHLHYLQLQYIVIFSCLSFTLLLQSNYISIIVSFNIIILTVSHYISISSAILSAFFLYLSYCPLMSPRIRHPPPHFFVIIIVRVLDCRSPPNRRSLKIRSPET